jgi:hypothetical protein
MTRPDLDAIEARANAATPGPWMCANRGDESGSVHPGTDDNWDIYTTIIEDFGSKTVYMRGEVLLEDGVFAAHARTDVPALVAYVRELEAQLKADAEIARLAREYVAADRVNTLDENARSEINLLGRLRISLTKAALIAAVSAEGE